MLPSYGSNLVECFSTEDGRGIRGWFGSLITTSQTLSVPWVTGKGIIQDKCDRYEFFWKWKADLRTCPFDVPPGGHEGPRRDIVLLFCLRQLSTDLLRLPLVQQAEEVDGLSQRSTAFHNAATRHIWTVAIHKKARQNHKSRHGTCWAFLNQDWSMQNWHMWTVNLLSHQWHTIWQLQTVRHLKRNLNSSVHNLARLDLRLRDKSPVPFQSLPFVLSERELDQRFTIDGVGHMMTKVPDEMRSESSCDSEWVNLCMVIIFH